MFDKFAILLLILLLSILLLLFLLNLFLLLLIWLGQLEIAGVIVFNIKMSKTIILLKLLINYL